MLSACFSGHGFVSIEFLPQGERYNLPFFTETVLTSIGNALLVARPRMRVRGTHLYVDNAKPHNSKISLSKTDEMRFVRVTQSLCPPDLAPCDFFLFGDLKEKLE
jgi:hypothetical protein